VRAELTVMGSEAALTLPDTHDRHLPGLIDMLRGLERRWTRFDESSEIRQLRSGRWNRVSSPTGSLLERCDRAWRLTGGVFDATMGEAMVANGYGGDRSIAPEKCGDRAGRWSEVRIDRTGLAVWIPEGVAIDAGGIGKGFAADLIVRRARGLGVPWLTVDVGGDMRLGGERAQPWTVAAELDGPGARCVVFEVTGGAMATSSTIRRSWGPAHDRRHHLLDPSTGWSSDSDLVSVSVWAPSAWQAEALATALMVQGSYAIADHHAVGLTRTGDCVAGGNLRPAA